MRNPLDVQMILFGDDVRMGLLQEMGFRKEPHPEGMGSSLYRREGVLLHSMGLWVEGVYYLRLREAFYRVEAPLVPLTEAPAEARVPLAEGLEALRPFACWYEAQDGGPGPRTPPAGPKGAYPAGPKGFGGLAGMGGALSQGSHVAPSLCDLCKA